MKPEVPASAASPAIHRVPIAVARRDLLQILLIPCATLGINQEGTRLIHHAALPSIVG